MGQPPHRGFGMQSGKQRADATRTHGPSDMSDVIEIKIKHLIRQGELHEAESLCKEIILEDPYNYSIHSFLGRILNARGDLASAKLSYRKAIDINPDSTEDICNLADLLKQSGEFEAAKSYYLDAVNSDQNCLRAHYNLGLINKAEGNLNDAITSFKFVARFKPDLAEAHISIGAILFEQGLVSAAIDSLKTALHYQPRSAQAHNNLGLCLSSIGDFKSAVHELQNAVSINPEFAEAYNNLGLTLQKVENFPDAIDCFQKALSLRKNFPEAHNNLGLALQEMGDIQMAIYNFKNALQLNPSLLEVKCNLSMLELLVGNYKQGLENYEFRFSTKSGRNVLLTNPNHSEWDGQNLKQGQKLLLISEQGLGDTIHFMRYAKTLRQREIDVTLCAQKKLHTLIQSSDIDSSPITPDEVEKFKDYQWTPLLSVARHLGIRPDNPITNDPYIKAPDKIVSAWSERLSSEQRPIIGINWQGNPDHEQTNSAGRSLPLETFAPISELENLSLLSLQKGFGSEQLNHCHFRNRFVQCQDLINDTWDFLETAAIIANCDLVITSDTSVAHLAGGLGKTTWLLLKQIPEWRWGIDDETTFWYPSMRLFRQTERGNWHGVMKHVVTALMQTKETLGSSYRTKINFV